MKTIIGCSNSCTEAEDLAKITNYSFVKSVKRYFPDGEMHIHLDKNIDEAGEVFIYQSTYPAPTEALFEILLISDLLKEKINNITLIAPWFAYSRQDKKWFPTECFSLKTVAKLLKCAGINKVITVDSHFHRQPGNFNMFNLEWTNVSAAKELVNYVRQKKGDVEIVGPDEGSDELLELVGGKVVFDKKKTCRKCKLPAQKCRCESSVKDYEITAKLKAEIKNNKVLIIDDIIGSGKTILSAVKELKNKDITVCATHGFFFNDSLNALKQLGVFIATTDSVKTEASKVSVNSILASIIKQ
ncbi:Ribose-phosphate pyrophosphokinase [Candidatus Tiddalikarchaeum anstoanum]|nr:Ribose-phosphate pyrophosphokinase [Candidatus Tiddalikarchaeum anstoanum]